MWPCPVCKTQISQPLCPDCGFDCSLDYESFPTFGKPSQYPKAISLLQKERSNDQDKERLCCKGCGSRRFRYEFAARAFKCIDCGQFMSVPTDKRLTASKKESAQNAPTPSNHKEDYWKHPSDPASCTVLAVGDNTYGQCNVKGWSNIKYTAVGHNHTVCLQKDGTVLCVGDNSAGQCSTQNWADIQAVDANKGYTLGLTTAGTVLTTGKPDKHFSTDSWTNVKAIAAGTLHAVGLRYDGTVLSTGGNFDGQCNTSDWKNIIAIAAGSYHTVGLRSNGTVVATGIRLDGQCDVSKWKRVRAIAAGDHHTVALRENGTVWAVGDNSNGQCNVKAWTKIIAIAAGGNKTLGFCSDGSILSTDPRDAVYNWRRIIDISISRNHTVGLQLP